MPQYPYGYAGPKPGNDKGDMSNPHPAPVGHPGDTSSPGAKMTKKKAKRRGQFNPKTAAALIKERRRRSRAAARGVFE
jgi:hypothetical protein